LQDLNLVVTTSREANDQQKKRAQELAQKLGLTFLSRREISLKEFFKISQGLIIIQAEKIVLKTSQNEFFFHPNMAKLRINNLCQGHPDHLIDTLDLQKGDSLLDCTLGLASDAITASFWIGKQGRIVGLEVIPLIYEITSYGLAYLNLPYKEIEEAMRRIKTINIHYLDYLKQLPDKSFDSVYFDPMFDKTISGASAMIPLREIAYGEPVTLESIQEAKRVARKRIVMKARKGSRELERLGFIHKSGGNYSNVEYGYFPLP